MRLILIDDHPLVLQGISAILQEQEDMELIGMATTGAEGIKLIVEHLPDLVVVDLMLPEEHGIDIIRKGRQLCPDLRFIILTSSASRRDIKLAMAEKVEGYILKEAMPEEIIAAIRLVYRGRSYVDPVIMQTLMDVEQGDVLAQLTPRELEVLTALATGMSNRDMADHLFITEYTVKKHVSQILDKLNLADRTQAALYAVSMGLGGIHFEEATAEPRR